jgi:pyridoxamine 5'-phosphate oxidase
MANKIFEEFGTSPLAIFQNWYAEANQQEINDPEAMQVATIDSDGKPSVRTVLLKEFSDPGFVFFTNYQSRKGRGLETHPYAELHFYWKSLAKQVRIAGPVEKTDTAASDAYFATRPRESQIGAWASSQTQMLDDFDEFRKKFESTEKKFEGKPVPRPPHWGGFRVKPERMEFWIAQPHRLHKRFVFEKKENIWNAFWLFP